MISIKMSTVILASSALFACGGGGGGGDSPSADLGITANPNVNDASSYELQKTTLHITRRYGINESSCDCFYHAVIYTDLDNDTDIDVFMSGGNGTQNPTPVEIYLNDGAGNFTKDNSPIFGSEPGSIHPRKALAGDYNGDGKLDIVIAGHGFDQPPFPGEHPLLFLSTSNGLEYSDNLEPYSGFFHSATSADIDNDGDIDIFITDNKVPFFLLNDGNGNFTKSTNRLSSALHNKTMFTSELIDVDKDGFVDLLVAGHEYEGMTTVIYWGSSTGSYTAANSTPLDAVLEQGTVLDMDAEDLDGDGKTDLLITRTGGGGNNNIYKGYYLQLLKGIGNHQFTDATAKITGNASASSEWIDWIRLQDFNDDGKIDIIEDNVRLGGALIWFNDGAGNFARN